MAIDRIVQAFQAEYWALQPEKIEVIAQLLATKLQGGTLPKASEIEAAENAQRRAVKSQGAIAVIPLYGTIARRLGAMEAASGGQSLDTFCESFRSALANEQVGSILIDFHTPGGSVYGIEEAYRVIAEGAKQKRVVGIANQLCASAGYYLMSACGEAVITPSGEVGSIGVYTAHFDYSKMIDGEGIKVTIIKAGAKKAEGNPYEALADDAREHTQSIVDAYYNQFVRAVAKGRGVGVDVVRGEQFGQGRTFDAARAVSRGLVDRVATFDETVADMQRKRWPNADGRAAVTVPTDIAAAVDASPLDAVGPFVERAAQALSGATAVEAGTSLAVLYPVAVTDALVQTVGILSEALARQTQPAITQDPTAVQGQAAPAVELAPTQTQPAPEAKEQPMDAASTAAQPSGAGALSADQVREQEKYRQSSIRAIGADHNIDAATVEAWIAKDLTIEAVRGEALGIISARTKADPAIRVGTQRETQKPFARLGEQLMSIAQSGKVGGTVDPRLHGIHAAATGAGEAVPSDGGFLLAPEFTSEILKNVYEMGEVASRVRKVPIGANKNGLKANAVDETSRATGSRFGGIQSYWVGEADTVTPTKPKFRQMDLTLKKLMSLFYATDELLEDSVALSSFAEDAFQEEVTFMTELGIFRGTGAGQPLGALNGGALITVSKESGQAADTFVAANATKMLSRIPSRSRKSAAWFVTQEIEAQLPLMTIGNQAVYLPPGGLRDAQYGSLLGRPVIPVEYCSAIGDLGDVCLFDLSQYLMIDKNAPQSAWSIHVRFLYDEQVFRITYRCDGQPIWNSALTPYLGSTTVSPFVTLQAR